MEKNAGIKADLIENYKFFNANIKDQLSLFLGNQTENNVQFKIKDETTVVYLIDFVSMRIKFYVEIDSNLMPKCFFENQLLCSNEIQRIFDYQIKVSKWSKLRKMESAFIKKCDRHHPILKSIVLMKIEEDPLIAYKLHESCACKNEYSSIFNNIVNILCNIMLSNYKKLRSNKIAERKINSGIKRKLKTLQ